VSSKNKISDLNNHLFAQLERLNNDDISCDQLQLEINRSKAISEVADMIIESSKVTIEAMKIMEKGGMDISRLGNNILTIGERVA